MEPAQPGGSHYEIAISQFSQRLGLFDPASGDPLSTSVWGYNGTYPGATIAARRGVPITVRWTNELVDASGDPLPHLLPVDSTLHWADPLGTGHVHGPYTGPVPIVTHLHGGHTRSDSDGLPDAWFTPDSNDPDLVPDYTGSLYNEIYTYDNDQEAATLWYHDHALGITRLNVYAGLAGYYLLRDAWDTGVLDDPATPGNENPSNLPAEQYEIPIAIQDRMFTSTGQLFYPSEPEEGDEHGGMLMSGEVPNPTVLPEFFGDHILVNGKAWPYVNVEPRKYRLRLLNGSDSRFYNLWLQGGPQIVQVGTDGGLLNSPVPMNQLLLGPGERADVVVDFSAFAGRTLTLRNNARGPFPKGDTVDPQTTGRIMQFRVGTTVTTPDLPLPTQLRPAPIEQLVATAPARKLMLFEGTDQYGRLQPMLGIVDPNSPNDGTLKWDDVTTETPALNSVEVWEIHNATADAHPIHLHLVQFQGQSRQKFGATITPKDLGDSEGGVLSDVRLRGQPKPVELNERGWKDTIIMSPGEVTRVIARFDRSGEYVWHCHILSHEDHEMMRRFHVGPQADAPLTKTSPGVRPSVTFAQRPISLIADGDSDDQPLEALLN
jgi:spore coat protein A